MKKVLLSLLVLFGLSFSYAQWSEGFETETDFALDNVTGWTFVDNDGGTTYGINNTEYDNSGYVGTAIVFNNSQTTPALTDAWAAHTGDKSLAFFASGANNTATLNDDWAILPQITVESNSFFSFWGKSITAQYGLERFQIAVSTTDTSPSSFTVISAGEYVEAPTDWAQFSYDLSAYEGQSIYIALHYVTADAFAFLTDDYEITQQTGDAPGCATLTAPADGATGVDVSDGYLFTWDAPTTGGTPTGYQVYVGPSADDLNLVNTVTETSIELTGPYDATFYWTVIPVNIVGSAEGCDVFSFTTSQSPFTPYCGPLAFASGVEPITHVNFAGIDNITVADGTDAHELFLDQVGNVSLGESYDITLKGNTVGDYENSFAVFIDWNQDGVFEGETEIIQITQTITNSTGEDEIAAVQSISVPADAMQGVTRMRVKKIYGTTDLLDPCANAAYGQAEDYTLQVGNMSVNDLTLTRSSAVYPNPAKDMVNVRLAEDFDAAKTTITLTSVSGKQVASFASVEEVNVAKLPAGVYVMTITDGNKTESKKLIKK